jgi:hypothetical protein
VKCRLCGAPVLVGQDDSDGGIETYVEPVPLSKVGEALAVLTGRRCVLLIREAGHWVIQRRLLTDVAKERISREDVLVEHKCGAPELPPAETTFPPVPPPRETELPTYEEPPF